VRTLKVRYQTDNSNTLDVIAEQDRKIHTIRGKKYLFTGADVQQDTKDPSVYIINYNWEEDRGTMFAPTTRVHAYVAGDFGPDVGSISVTPHISNEKSYVCGFSYLNNAADFIASSFTPVLVRAPYISIDITAPKNEASFPRPVGLKIYDESPLGWQELPGMIPL
jgi:hypothetical protein